MSGGALVATVGSRRNVAEVDRVREVTPGVFAFPITYALSCKYGLVNKGHVIAPLKLQDAADELRWQPVEAVGVEVLPVLRHEPLRAMASSIIW